MTIAYSTSAHSPLGFFRLLLRWKGSIWKLIYTELAVFLAFYYLVFCVYRFQLNSDQQRQFALVSNYIMERLHLVPLNFMLGFFVTIVIDRWRTVFNNMGWVENTALAVAAVVQGEDDETRLVRRSIVRYLCLAQVLAFRDISLKVRRRFPTLESIATAGFIHAHELKELEAVQLSYSKHWLPINWACALAVRMRETGKIRADQLLNGVLIELRNFRVNLQQLINFDWIPIPLAYPQVVFLAVRVYFFLCCIARQDLIEPLESSKKEMHIVVHFPVMTTLEFLFTVGWMKVAETLLNPLGDDDDHFECNFLLDRNIATGMAIVTVGAGRSPDLHEDIFQADSPPLYSLEAAGTSTDRALVGSVANLELSSPSGPVQMVQRCLVEEQTRTPFGSRPPSLLRRRVSLRPELDPRTGSTVAPPFSSSWSATWTAFKMPPSRRPKVAPPLEQQSPPPGVLASKSPLATVELAIDTSQNSVSTATTGLPRSECSSASPSRRPSVDVRVALEKLDEEEEDGSMNNGSSKTTTAHVSPRSTGSFSAAAAAYLQNASKPDEEEDDDDDEKSYPL